MCIENDDTSDDYEYLWRLVMSRPGFAGRVRALLDQSPRDNSTKIQSSSLPSISQPDTLL